VLPVVVPGADDAALNALNKEILLRIQESGVAIPSQTLLSGKFADSRRYHDHRSRREDFDQLCTPSSRPHGTAARRRACR